MTANRFHPKFCRSLLSPKSYSLDPHSLSSQLNNRGSVLVYVSNITIKNTTLHKPHKMSNVILRDGNEYSAI